jgi:hypothetical protein
MDWDASEPLRRARTLQRGFALMATALAEFCVIQALVLVMLLGRDPNVAALRSHPAWFWLVEAPAPWLYLIGSYMVWGAIAGVAWRRVAGMLVLLNAVGVVLWIIIFHQELGLPINAGAELNPWLIDLVSISVAWVKLLLLGLLAASWQTSLEGEEATPLRPSPTVHTLAVVGLLVWVMLALGQTRWRFGPIRPRVGPGFARLYLLTMVLRVVAYFVLAAQVLEASRRAGTYWTERQPKDRGEELLFGPHDEDDDPFGR